MIAIVQADAKNLRRSPNRGQRSARDQFSGRCALRQRAQPGRARSIRRESRVELRAKPDRPPSNRRISHFPSPHERRRQPDRWTTESWLKSQDKISMKDEGGRRRMNQNGPAPSLTGAMRLPFGIHPSRVALLSLHPSAIILRAAVRLRRLVATRQPAERVRFAASVQACGSNWDVAKTPQESRDFLQIYCCNWSPAK